MVRAVRSLPLLASLAALGCSRGGDPLAWISERSAVVRCASAGKRPPAPAIAGVPAPPAPTGLFARQLDPIALDALGYTRDAVVCATLEAPPTTDVDASAELQSIVALHRTVGIAAMRAGGRCTCEVARAQGNRELVAACVQAPTVAGCDPNERADEVADALAPLLDALDDVTLPWQHWRLVGPTDRPGWFADHLDDAIANHDGGSIVFRPGEPLPTRTDAVVRGLIGAPNVVAVVRQDGGRALLVARELDGLLVLDHFRQPLASAERIPLVSRMEAAQLAAITAALSPGPVRETLLRPGDGTLVEFDRPLLEEIDRAALATAPLLGITRDDPLPPPPPALFDRVAYAAPYGESGTVLRIEHALSVDGLAWAQTLTDAPLLGGLDGLGLSPQSDVPIVDDRVARSPVVADRFVLRGTATARWGLHGVHHFGTLASLLEIAAPGAIGGDQSAWRLDWPGAALPAELDAGPGTMLPFEGVRTLAGQRAYRLAAGFDPARTRLSIELRPR